MNNRKTKTNVWFAAGLSLGALGGILLAPKSGCETRKAIAAGVDDAIEYVTSLGRDARKRMSVVAPFGKNVLRRRKEETSAAS